jgi:hypothetical protein
MRKPKDNTRHEQSQQASVIDHKAAAHSTLNLANWARIRIASPKFLATCLLVMVSVSVFVVRARPVARAANTGAPEHVLSFAYYSIKDDWDSMLTLNNSSVIELVTTVTVYSLDGRALTLPTLAVKPNSNIAVSLREYISRTKQSDQFQEGSIDVRFNSDDSMAITPQLTVADVEHGMSFDMEPPMMPMSSTLEGLWWSLDDTTSGQVMLSNTTDTALKSLVNVEWGGTPVKGREVSLSAHQTAVLDIKEILSDLQIEAQGIERGGISITHNEMPGAVIAHGVILKKEARFASNLPFVDPTMQKNSVLNGTGLMLAHPASGSAFPETSFFTPQLALRNISGSSQMASVTVRYTSDGRLTTKSLPTISIAPHEVRMADFSTLMSEVRNVQIASAGITIDSSGAPGTLLAALTSTDDSQNIEVDVPLVSRSVRSGEGGNHPFRLGKTSRSVAYMTNITSKPTKVAVIIFHSGAMYLPPLIDIAPGGTVAIDLLQLRDSQTKDIQGHTLPANLTEGQFFWHPHQGEALIGRVAMLDQTGSTTSNFSCPNCCQMEPGEVDIVPGIITGQIGEFCQLTVWEWDTYCGQFHAGPYNYTNSVNYSCDNTTIATVNSGGGMSCVGLGNATLTVSFDYYHSDYISGEDCGLFVETATATAPVTVFRLRIRTAGTSIHFEDSDSGASIVAGETFAIIAEAINAVGNVLPINVAVSTSPSRTLASGEIGVPSSFNIVNGSYNSGGLLLNRVNSTQSGTSYRFSTAAGGFKDFFLYTYFRVVSTREGLVGGLLWCGGTVQPNDHFVSLPVAELCGVSVVVRNPGTGQSETTTKKDKGPHFPGPRTPCDPDGSMGGDFYWNTGTRPRVENLTCEDGNNNAGIDLADGTFATLGSPSQVVWRFGS